MKLVCWVNGHWVDADSGESVDIIDTLSLGVRGVLCGFDLYETLLRVYESLSIITEYEGKELKISGPGRNGKSQTVFRHYWYKISCRTQGGGGNSPRKTVTKTWVIWNRELLDNDRTLDPIEAPVRLLKLLDDRGVKPSPTPGGMAKAMFKSSSEWSKDRYAAPPWISEIARRELPGNYYSLREGFKRSRNITLIDQQAAHHKICNSIPLPHPQSVHRRRRRVPGQRDIRLIPLNKFKWHMGLLLCKVEAGHIPPQHAHLYPQWCKTFGVSLQWVWTPELRLLNEKVRILGVQSALTGVRMDTVPWEYSDFALDQLSKDKHPIIKPVLHAAYGGMAVNSYEEYNQTILGDTGKFKDPKSIRLPWTDLEGREVTIKNLHVSPVQNVVAYGVIGAEQTTRSLELARRLELDEGIMVVQVYADALLVKAAQLPFVPDGWDIKGDLGDVVAGRAHEIISTHVQKLPGLHGERQRQLYITQVTNETRTSV